MIEQVERVSWLHVEWIRWGLVACVVVLVVAGAGWWWGTRRVGSRWLLRQMFLMRWRGSAVFHYGLLAVAVMLLGLGAAMPRVGSVPLRQESEHLSVVIVLDASWSMKVRDVKPDRFTLAVQTVRNLLEGLASSEVALVVFAGSAIAYVPFTSDVGAVGQLLSIVDPYEMPTPGTILSEAFERAKLLAQGKHNIGLVLISDGEFHDEEGLEAIVRSLEESPFTVVAIGVGTPAGGPVPQADGGYLRLADGTPVVSRLVEENLQRLAQTTKGVYLRLNTPTVTAEEALRWLRRHLPGKPTEEEFVSYVELYWVPALVALILLIIHLGTAERMWLWWARLMQRQVKTLPQ